MKRKMDLFKCILMPAVLSAVLGCFFISGKAETETVYVSAEVSLSENTAEVKEVNQAANPVITVDAAAAPTVAYPAAAYVASDSAHTLAIVLPQSLDVGNEAYCLASVTGYRISVYNGGVEIYNTGDEYKDAGTGVVNLEELVRKISPSFKNATENVAFKVNYIGKNAAGEYADAKDAAGGNIEWISEILTVYRVTITGVNLTPVITYGFSGQTIGLVPTPANGYRFEKWSDANTQNPRMVKISTNTAENEYVAITGVPDVTINEDSGEYDIIPQTGEGNSPFWLIFFSVFGVFGTGYALYMLFIPMFKLGSGRFDDF